jgi:uncharacterized protein involved in cysteine biosynthesis
MPPSLLTPAWLAVAQLDDPALQRVVLRSVGLAVLALVAVGVGLGWGGVGVVDWWWAPADPAAAPGTEAAPPGWLGWVAGAAGVLGAVGLGLFLFVPLATGIATLFSDSVAEAVERRHYPQLDPGRAEGLALQAWDGLALALRVLAMQVLALLLSLLVPGLGLVVGWLVASWAIGKGLFMAIAMRRVPRPVALALYRQRRVAVVAQGGLVALAGLVPGLNLIAPVLGLAAMVHVLGVPGRMEGEGGLSGRV